MNLNFTLIGQTITFIVFVLFCMKYIWPPLMRVLDERKTRIADGLAAGEKGRHELELAEKRALEVLKKAKANAQEVIALAEKRAPKSPNRPRSRRAPKPSASCKARAPT